MRHSLLSTSLALGLAFLPSAPPALAADRAPSPVLAAATYDHVAINVADFDRMLAWYRDTLGFEVELAWKVAALDGKRLAYLTLNGSRIELVAADRGARPAGAPADFAAAFGRTGYAHLCLAVASVDAVLAELRARGVPAFVEAATYVLDGTRYQRRVGFVLDPEGNVIEFGEPLRTVAE